MLTRRKALGLIGASALAGPVAAQARLDYALVPQPVAPDVWMIEGATDHFSRDNGGAIVNVVLMKGQTGLIVIDTGPSRRYGEALARVARSLDLRGVSAVVNTHHHPDHFFGNQALTDAPILALGETRAAAAAEGDAFSDNMYRLLGDWMRGTEVVPPTRVLDAGIQTIDGRRVDVLPLGGHTVADLALVDLETGLLIAGDLVFHNRAPTTPNADVPRWLASLEALDAVSSTAVLPGHGRVDRAGVAIAQTRDYLSWLDGTLRMAARDGLDMVEIMQKPLPGTYATMGAQPQEFERSVAHLFPAIERDELPRGN